jgi:methyl-accepting chemotaxis protein
MNLEDKPKKFTSSIRANLVASFSFVALGSLVLAVLVLVLHGIVTKQYVQVTDRLILENRFASLVPEYLDSYFGVISGGSGTTGKLTVYNSSRDEINKDIAKLDLAITDPGSLVSYRGFKNFVLNIVSECDTGVNLVQQGKVSEAWVVYTQNIAPMKPFVFENASVLMTNELKVAEGLEARAAAVDRLTGLAYLFLFLAITAAVILVSLKTANRVIKPMDQLSKKAQTIAGGDLGAEVGGELLERRDEIGSLANSFDEMLKRLKTELEAQRQTNRALALTSDDLESKNEKLEQTNRLMIKREMKMAELKNQILELESKMRK